MYATSGDILDDALDVWLIDGAVQQTLLEKWKIGFQNGLIRQHGTDATPAVGQRCVYFILATCFCQVIFEHSPSSFFFDVLPPRSGYGALHRTRGISSLGQRSLSHVTFVDRLSPFLEQKLRIQLSSLEENFAFQSNRRAHPYAIVEQMADGRR